MKTEAKGLLLLLGTLSLGVLLGAAGNGTLQRERRKEVEEMRRPGGFAEHMMQVIRPRDEAQRNALLPVVQATDERNRQIIHAANTELRAALDSMRAQLAPQLDAGQRARLEEFARMAPPPPGLGRPHHGSGGRRGPGRRGGPGHPGGPGGPPPHDEWGPPPPRDGDGPPFGPPGGPPPPRDGERAEPPAQPQD